MASICNKPCLDLNSDVNGKILVIFDFDSTLVDENSDTIFTKVLTPDLMPDYLDLVRSGYSWISTVNTILQRVHSRGFHAEHIREALANHVKIAPSMRQLVERLAINPQRYDLIIISDSNELFISWILSSLGLPSSMFAAIYTNRATISADGLIEVFPHHVGDHAHRCQRTEPKCPERLCKTRALEQFLMGRRGHYERKIYLGDGKGDVCPVLSSFMGHDDVAMARKDWALAKYLNGLPKDQLSLQVLLWTMENVDDVFKKAEGSIRTAL